MSEDKRENKRKYDARRGQYRLALSLLGASGVKPPARALDVGAGMGEFALLLSDLGYRVVCTDGTELCCASCVERGFESWRVDLEEERLPFEDDSFDLAVSLEVIEHLWNTGHYLSELRRVVKPGGFLLLTTPNYNYWPYRLSALRGTMERFLYKSRHKKFFTARSFARRVGEQLRVEKQLGFGWIPGTGIVFVNKRAQNFLSAHIGVLCRPV